MVILVKLFNMVISLSGYLAWKLGFLQIYVKGMEVGLFANLCYFIERLCDKEVGLCWTQGKLGRIQLEF